MFEAVEVGTLTPTTSAWAARVLGDHFFEPQWLAARLGIELPIQTLKGFEFLPFDRQLIDRYTLLPALAGVSVKSLVERFPKLFIHLSPNETAPWFTRSFEQSRWIMVAKEPEDETCGHDVETAVGALESGELMPTPLIAAYLAVACALKRMHTLFQEKRTMCREHQGGKVLVFGQSLANAYPNTLTFFPFTHWDTRIGITAWQTWSAEEPSPY